MVIVGRILIYIYIVYIYIHIIFSFCRANFASLNWPKLSLFSNSEVRVPGVLERLFFWLKLKGFAQKIVFRPNAFSSVCFNILSIKYGFYTAKYWQMTQMTEKTTLRAKAG